MMLKESIAMYKLQKEAEKGNEAVREVILTVRGKERVEDHQAARR